MTSRTGNRFRVSRADPRTITDELGKVDQAIRGKIYLKADLPRDGSLLIAPVSDETGGHTLAFWDGSDWRRAQDLAVVS